jgi:tRNA pseudouridine55 synthase
VDLAGYLNCCSHVSQLRRLASGGFDVNQAIPLEKLDGIVSKGELHQLLIPLAQALSDYPELRVSHPVAKQLRQGRIFHGFELQAGECGRALPKGPYRALDPEDNLVAMVAKSDDESLNNGEENTCKLEILRVFASG